MGLETASYISGLNPLWPLGADFKSAGDDHLRLIKGVLQTQFPNFGTAAPMNASIVELNYMVGVTSLVQSQLNLKAPLAGPALTGVPTTPTASPGTGGTQIASNAYADAAVAVETGRATGAEGILSSAKANLASPAFTGTPTAPTAGTGSSGSQLATLDFVNNTSFAAILPSTTGKPTGASLQITGPGTYDWKLSSFSYTPRTSNTIFAAADSVKTFDYTSGTFTQTYTSFVTLAAGWIALMRNAGSGVITHDPAGTETIGGATTATQNQGDVWMVEGDGTNGQLLRLAGMNNLIITSGSGNFTFPPGCNVALVEIQGAGGGAGASTNAYGGGGGYAKKIYRGAANSTVAYSVGAGVSASAGQSTTFGTMTANGGSPNNGNPGTASGGDVNYFGGQGFSAGTTLLGGAAPTVGINSTATSGNGTDGVTPGAGASNFNSASNFKGGDGKITIWFT